MRVLGCRLGCDGSNQGVGSMRGGLDGARRRLGRGLGPCNRSSCHDVEDGDHETCIEVAYAEEEEQVHREEVPEIEASQHRAGRPPRLSYGQIMGLHSTPDPLSLRSSVALVVDQDTNEVLFSKNPQAVLPIASITKLMTALMITEAQPATRRRAHDHAGRRGHREGQPFATRRRHAAYAWRDDAPRAHVFGESRRPRARPQLPGRPAGVVAAMNRKAQQLGMNDTHYVDPTGLSSANQSSARDLAALVKAAYDSTSIRSLSTSPRLRGDRTAPA